MNERLLETLRDAQRFGFFGSRPIEQAAAHSLAFVEAIGDLGAGARVVDLGSGGGLPGLILADNFPEAAITLIDRREKRTDFLRRAVKRLGYGHVTVLALDVERLASDVAAGLSEPFDVVTARGFGPPAVTLEFGTALLAAGGRIVVSEPPSGDRWDRDLLDSLGLTHVTSGRVSVFQHVTA